MPENLLIKKRQRQRKRNGINLTTKHLLGLVVLALVTYGAFRVWVGNPWESVCGDNCESMYSLLAWILAFGMIFGAIIIAGAVVGVIISLVKRRSMDTDLSPFAAPQGPEADKPDTKSDNSDE